MLRLMRYKGGGFYAMPDNKGSSKPLFELWVTDIDIDGEYVEMEIKGTDNDRAVTIHDSVDIMDDLNVSLGEIFWHKEKLSVALLFDTKYRIIRQEILYKEDQTRITKRHAGNT